MNKPRKSPPSRSPFVAGLTSLATISSRPPGARTPPLKVLCIGAHPDDPETACGGTLLRLKQAGHTLTVVYLTRGEAGVKGKTHQEAAKLRTKEAKAACRILQARPVFFGQVDAAAVFDDSAVRKMQRLFAAEKPDIVFTHWPVDLHPDHPVTSMLTLQAWARSPARPALYFYEACIGQQTRVFSPTDYVDITEVQELKTRAVYCHRSQFTAANYAASNHPLMESFRGAECGVAAAEAFIRFPQNPA